jgi:HAD superfamily hydrolase (TIGR01509 family)
MSFKAVIFDCDGVLVDSEILGLEDSAAYLRRHNLDWSASDLVRLFTGLRDDLFRERLTAAYFDANAAPPPAGFFDGLVEHRRSRRHELREVPGAAAFLEELRLPRAVASSSRADILAAKLQRVRLLEYFSGHVYSGDSVDRGKPAPDLFILAAERLGLDPADCLVVEDSVNGVLAGRAAGMAVCAFTAGSHCFDGHEGRLREAGAHYSAGDFAALARLVLR